MQDGETAVAGTHSGVIPRNEGYRLVRMRNDEIPRYRSE